MLLLEHPIARDMISLFADVFSDALQQLSIHYPYALEKTDKIIRVICPIRTAMLLAT